jgi:glyceraldehyde 3-phosphate dehydrogenase
MALRVPVPDGSIVDLVAILEQNPEPEEINRAFHVAAAGPLQGIVDYCTTPVVSSDIVGNPHSCVFDTAFTRSLGEGFVHVLAWYDNEWGYSNRVVDLIARLASLA